MTGILRPRVVLISERFGPYHVARLRASQALCEVTAVEIFSQDKTYAWSTIPRDQFERTTLFATEKDGARPGAIRRKVKEVLSYEMPDAVAIPGWGTAANIAALEWCLATGKRSILISDSTRLDFRRRSWIEAAKKRVVSLFNTALVGGVRQKEYLVSLGLPADRIFLSCAVVDNEHFRSGADAARSDSAKVRAQLGLPENYFLTCTRLVPKKNLSILIQAFVAYTKKVVEAPWSLVLVGDGPLRESLQREAGDAGVHGLVQFRGFQQYEELPKYYGLAGAFVLPSRSEQWGLVVNEAMAAGLPVLVSSACGCSPDLVSPSRNGWVFEPENLMELARRMTEVAGPACDRSFLGTASRSVIATHTPANFGQALFDAWDRSLPDLPRTPSAITRFLLSRLSRK